MRLSSSRKVRLVALLSSICAGVLGASLALTPAAAAGPQPALEVAHDDVSAEQQGSLAGNSVTLRAVEEPGIDTLNGGGGAILCVLSVANPQVPVLKPTQIEGSALVQCTAPLPGISLTVALFRGDNRVSSKTTNVVGSHASASAFGPCQGGAYYATATATLLAPPGYSPAVAVIGVVSNVVPINGAGTAFPPSVCKQSSSPPPPPPPPPPSHPYCPDPSKYDCMEP